VQYDDDELDAKQLGFVTVHCKYAETSETPPNRSFLLLCGSNFMFYMVAVFNT